MQANDDIKHIKADNEAPDGDKDQRGSHPSPGPALERATAPGIAGNHRRPGNGQKRERHQGTRGPTLGQQFERHGLGGDEAIAAGQYSRRHKAKSDRPHKNADSCRHVNAPLALRAILIRKVPLFTDQRKQHTVAVTTLIRHLRLRALDGISAPLDNRIPLWPFATISILAALATSALVFRPSIEAWWYSEIVASSAEQVPRPVHVIVGTVPLSVPYDLVRFPGQRRDAAVDRLELVLRWPPHSASGAGQATGRAGDTDVLIALSPPDDSLNPTRRLGAIYHRLLDPATLNAPQGLTGRRFVPDSGYEGEELFYDPASPTSYFVRCAPPITDQPGTCLREIRLTDRLDVVYRFPRSLLGQWRRLDETISALLAAISTADR